MNLFNRGKAITSNRAFPFFFIAIVIAVAYGSILSHIYSLRNDQLNYFLPVRMYMSDAFNHHEFMLWNPFMTGSYPLHADMQSSVWNPFVVVLAWLFNYNITLFSFELLMYYIIGAFGCYYFVRNFSSNTLTPIALAICYGCSGVAASDVEFMSWVRSIALFHGLLIFFINY